MALLIRNGRIITATDDYVADIYCAGETITRIEKAGGSGRTGGTPVPPAPGVETIDAFGKFVFPGFIDPHVHIYLPFMGTYAKDTWETASRAALVGGTTTLIEMICPGKTDDALAAYELWESKARGLASCDYTFHMGVTRYDRESEKHFREIVKRGITSFKVFLAYKGALGVDDSELYHALKLAKELGVIVTAHCENETLIAARQAELLAAGKSGPEWHEPSRPPAVEAEGVHHLMTFAQLTGAATYIVHTSCAEAIGEALRARANGARVWIETVIPYLTLDKSYAEKPGFEGAKYIMSPPLRDTNQQAYLWEALRSRIISTVATDHAPFDFETQKVMGRPPKGDFTKIPNGIPSVENRVDLLYTRGVAAASAGLNPGATGGSSASAPAPAPGKIDLNTFVDCASTQAARLFGLKTKGTIAPGYDADLVIYDPAFRGTISAKTHHMATDYSAFEGWEVKGRAAVVTVRGRVMVRDGKFVGAPGSGRLLQREACHV
jgi:dihydropyrimidinase